MHRPGEAPRGGEEPRKEAPSTEQLPNDVRVGGPLGDETNGGGAAHASARVIGHDNGVWSGKIKLALPCVRPPPRGLPPPAGTAERHASLLGEGGHLLLELGAVAWLPAADHCNRFAGGGDTAGGAATLPPKEAKPAVVVAGAGGN